jgi:hypothetical protein
MSEVGEWPARFLHHVPPKWFQSGEPIPECREAFRPLIFTRIEANSMSYTIRVPRM